MNYTKHYDLLILKYGRKDKPEFYSERHHIIPKCVGGTNNPNNLVYLTPREHLLAHWLLSKIYSDNKLKLAFATMCTRDGIKLTPRLYQSAREAVSGANSVRAKKIVTPLGTFETARAAAKAHKTSIASIWRKAKSKSVLHQGYYYLDEPIIGSERTKHGLHWAKQIVTPLGQFESVRSAGVAHSIHHSTISKRLKRGDDGYYYL